MRASVIGRALIGTTLGLAAVLACATASVAAAGEPALTQAQIALFESNHLKSITHPVKLQYAFKHQGGESGNFEDKITADIRDIRADGRKDIWVDFLTGSHHVNFPPAMDFEGNPLLMYFLEHDVVEMEKATGGSSGYFRNRIREAFLKADMHPTDVTVDGKTCTGHEIVIAPFRTDAHLAQFPGFRDKTYHFTLCDRVPGTIYRISTSVPAVGDGVRGAFEEAMTYEGEHAR